MDDQLGRRERKRQETRDRIAAAARTLFAERGFDAVTVAEIAEAADVSEPTVYNHFATKEDLVLWRRGTFEANLVEAIRDRPPGQSALAAFHGFVTAPRAEAQRAHAGPAAAPGGDEARLILDSAALRERERSIVASHTAALAALLADETGAGPDDLEPWVAAAAMFGAAQALVEFARRRVVEGARPPDLTRALRHRADRAVALLEGGLGDYAIKQET